MTEYLTTGAVARAAGVSDTAITKAIGRGDLTPAATTDRGWPLFSRESVDAFVARRAARDLVPA